MRYTEWLISDKNFPTRKRENIMKSHHIYRWRTFNKFTKLIFYKERNALWHMEKLIKRVGRARCTQPRQLGSTPKIGRWGGAHVSRGGWRSGHVRDKRRLLTKSPLISSPPITDIVPRETLDPTNNLWHHGIKQRFFPFKTSLINYYSKPNPSFSLYFYIFIIQ